MSAEDIAVGRGVCLVDPHGDLAESIACLVPKHRTNDVILFDVASRKYAVGFNPLASRDPSRVDQVTSGVVINDETADAAWGNVGSIVAFQVGSEDADLIAQQLGKCPGQITPENLSGLPKYAAYRRLLIDGMPSNPFSLQTLPPCRESFDPERAEIIRRVSRGRFAQGNQAQV
ncbi:MAG: hypothetical protein MUE50_26220 [Pirellulaceae bacterium]|nr:hypothetical protein [Pirellulaceae bacterium]